MSLWSRIGRRGWLGVLLVAGLSLAAVWPAAGFGQSDLSTSEAQWRDGRLGRTTTVSVATLRVPPQAWRHFNKAKSAGERNRLEEFERETARALEIAPEFAAAHLLRADMLVRAKRFAEAVDEVAAARRSDPGVMWAAVIQAGAYNGLHRYWDALSALDTRPDARGGIESESWQAMYERARAEIGLGNVESGLRWSAKALEAAPESFPDVHLVRANALLVAQRSNEAQTQMEMYLASRGTQAHRDEVVAMRAQMRAPGGRYAAASR
jgi:tetratricopeptide (TPR) repeat protein